MLPSHISVFRYGCHIFHTKHDRVKEYVQQYSDWVPYEHRVIAKAKDVDGKVKFVPMPPNQVIMLEEKKITWIRGFCR